MKRTLPDEIGFEKTEQVLNILRRCVIPLEDAIMVYSRSPYNGHYVKETHILLDDLLKFCKELEKDV